MKYKIGDLIIVKKGVGGLNSLECMDNKIGRIDEVRSNGKLVLIDFFKKINRIVSFNRDLLDNQRCVGVDDIKPINNLKLKALLKD